MYRSVLIFTGKKRSDVTSIVASKHDQEVSDALLNLPQSAEIYNVQHSVSISETDRAVFSTLIIYREYD